MMFNTFIAGLAISSLGLVVGATEAPIPGYGVVPFSWEVETSSNGATAILNGTVEEVYAQILQINPDFKLNPQPAPTKRSRQPLKKRDNVLCGLFSGADQGAINQGISYLRGLNGQPSMGPGPGNCGRVSCSYNSAIWWCNDNTSPLTLSWNNIADSAQLIINTCGAQLESLSGQDFHTNDWNGIVRGDSC